MLRQNFVLSFGIEEILSLIHILSKEALQKVMKPENYVGRAPEQTEEFLNGVIKPILAENKDALGMHAEINV